MGARGRLPRRCDMACPESRQGLQRSVPGPYESGTPLHRRLWVRQNTSGPDEGAADESPGTRAVPEQDERGAFPQPQRKRESDVRPLRWVHGRTLTPSKAAGIQAGAKGPKRARAAAPPARLSAGEVAEARDRLETLERATRGAQALG
ncbi:MAG: hypothetical protein M1823_007601, partial [Watsoniomyces obsoletus]